MKRTALLLAATLLAAPLTTHAQDVGFDGFLAMFKAHPPQTIAPPDIKPIPLASTGSPDTALWETFEGWRTVRNVTQPALYPVLPAAGTANGTAVIIAPGGAFLSLSFDTEGMEVAKYLAARGVTCFVLTYRLDATPKDIDGFGRTIGQRIGKAPAKMTHGEITSPAEALAQADGLSAVTYVRSHAAEYGIDAHKIGFMGFSAGGMTTMNVATAYTAASRPDFIGVIYGASPSAPYPPTRRLPLSPWRLTIRCWVTPARRFSMPGAKPASPLSCTSMLTAATASACARSAPAPNTGSTTITPGWWPST